MPICYLTEIMLKAENRVSALAPRCTFMQQWRTTLAQSGDASLRACPR